ncbi:helix-turn-helix domain-containing protein [Flammeovirga agarivorans]|uniref:Helix-turn-helix domain-containing protein n=1 Tax=Flammeovirga agarivorans TaxID=2726742 RepID=A0A7X8SRM1_9BACT|nr:helix-turn-helix domain-containing protein [Flammeovirga agarivorans]NLR94972.1 helix-turn-helix domain-containing protein [Flammeovirga agarivorans]
MKSNYYHQLLPYFTFICALFQSFSVGAVNFVINQLPLHHPVEEPLYLVGSFNAWNPMDQKYQFQKGQDGKLYVYISDHLNAFEYKITRGGWDKVESTNDGKPKANRVFISENESDTVRIDILGWEDLAGQTTIVLESLPNSTPYESKFFVAGNFNNWRPDDLNYQFTLNEEGNYTLTLPSKISSFQFKVTRGSWSTIECLSDGKYRPNRVYDHKSKGPEQLIVSIEDWEDVNKSEIWDLPQLTSFLLFHIVLLIVYFLWMNYKNHELTYPLLILISTFVILLFFSFSLYMPFKNQMGGVHLIHYLFIPILYLVISNVQDSIFRSYDFKKNIPFLYIFGLGLCIIYAFYLLQEETLLVIFLERLYPQMNLFIKGLFLVLVVISWLQSKDHLEKYNTESLQGSVVKSVKKSFAFYQKYSLLVIVGYTIGVVIQVVNLFIEKEHFLYQDLSDKLIWYSTFIYFVITSAWVFRYHHTLEPIEQKSSYRKEEDITQSKELEEFIEKVTDLFEKEKLYTKQDLSLNDVSNLLNIPSHKLTKLIQQAYKRNFSELVNDYRVQAFTKRVLVGDAEKSTLLSIAYEVGFQSKSTFNRAFKKSTGMTPKEFMKKSSVKKILD